jgi:hypothetical protein
VKIGLYENFLVLSSKEKGFLISVSMGLEGRMFSSKAYLICEAGF